MNISAGPVAVREFPLSTGFADYLLYVDAKAIGIIEAKPEGTRLPGWKLSRPNTRKDSPPGYHTSTYLFPSLTNPPARSPSSPTRWSRTPAVERFSRSTKDLRGQDANTKKFAQKSSRPA